MTLIVNFHLQVSRLRVKISLTTTGNCQYDMPLYRGSPLKQPDKQSPPLGDFGKEHLPFLLGPCKKQLSRRSPRFEKEEGLWIWQGEKMLGDTARAMCE